MFNYGFKICYRRLGLKRRLRSYIGIQMGPMTVNMCFNTEQTIGIYGLFHFLTNGKKQPVVLLNNIFLTFLNRCNLAPPKLLKKVTTKQKCLLWHFSNYKTIKRVKMCQFDGRETHPIYNILIEPMLQLKAVREIDRYLN